MILDDQLRREGRMHLDRAVLREWVQEKPNPPSDYAVWARKMREHQRYLRRKAVGYFPRKKAA